MTDQPPRILCQPDGAKSCGACCGMYNHIDHGPSATRRRLTARTLQFHKQVDVTDTESLAQFRERYEDGDDVKMLTALPSCPFLGFIDLDGDDDSSQGSKVGCLVHPAQNGGVDGRDCGVYDRFICDEYLCAAHDVLRRDEVQLVVDAVEDSYLYGLLITNPKYVRHLLKLVADRVGARPDSRQLRDKTVIDAAGDCFELMRRWSFRGEEGIYGQVRVDADLNMKRRPLPAEKHGVDAEPVDVLLVCLGTECEDVEQLHRARRIVDDRVEALARAVAELRP